MRLALVRNVLAATSMVVLAFVIPLALLAKQIAYDRAISDARSKTGPWWWQWPRSGVNRSRSSARWRRRGLAMGGARITLTWPQPAITSTQ